VTTQPFDRGTVGHVFNSSIIKLKGPLLTGS